MIVSFDAIANVTPPFEITPQAAGLLAEIERRLGRYEGAMPAPASPLLRRSQRVRTVHASVAIEGNTLSEEQVTAVLEGKHVAAPARDLREVQNAIACYERLPAWNPYSTTDFLAAHRLMLGGLIERAGRWRMGGVGVVKGSTVSHIAPPADRVPGLIRALFDWMKKDRMVPLMVRAAVCHYEMEFIHPFTDGNGRMGRLWHSLLLSRHHPLFAHLPVESVIRTRQADYYGVLGRCGKVGKSTEFIVFALEVVLEALNGAMDAEPIVRMTAMQRIAAAREHFGTRSFARRDYLARFPGLSSATASRDLQEAVKAGLVDRDGNKARAVYQFRHPSLTGN